MLKISVSQLHYCMPIMLTKHAHRYFSHSIEPLIEPYLINRLTQFEESKKAKEPSSGFYTKEGSILYFQRFAQVQTKSLLAVDKNIRVSSIGAGTYKGSLDPDDDILQFNSITDSVLSGLNVIDTCSNFRGGRSEMSIGYALNYLLNHKNISRNQLFLMSKAGYVREKLPAQLANQIINDHCVHPTYLEQSLRRSLNSLGVEVLDVFYLNNFAESQLQQLGREQWETRLAKAFEFMEKARRQQKIQYYGLSSWQAFRVAPQDPSHVNLNKIIEIAEKVGGLHHGFKFVQVPINIMMPEIFAEKTQSQGSFLETAEALKINVISNSPLLNGTLINTPLPADRLGCIHNGAKHLQMIRSIPSPALVCTLIGQKTNRHTKKNLQVATVPYLTEQQWFQLFVPNQDAQKAAANLKQ